MKQIVYGTFHMSDFARHHLEFAHLEDSPAKRGVVSALVEMWNSEGVCIYSCKPPLDRAVWELLPELPLQKSYLVTIRTWYEQSAPHFYGFISYEGLGVSRVYYPVNFALGSRHTSVHDHIGHFVWGTVPNDHTLLFFAANPSRWASVRGTLTLRYLSGLSRHRIELGPKLHVFLDLMDLAKNSSALGCPTGLDFASSSKLITYVIGQHRRHRCLTFVDHLIERKL